MTLNPTVTRLRPFHRFEIRPENLSSLFPRSRWLQGFHLRLLIEAPQVMLGFLCESTQREYTLGGPEETRFSWSRVSVDSIPAGTGLLRLRTSNRDSHFQFFVNVWISDSGVRNIEVIGYELNLSENSQYIRVHESTYHADRRPLLDLEFYGIKTVGYHPVASPKEVGLLDRTSHTRLKRFSDLFDSRRQSRETIVQNNRVAEFANLIDLDSHSSGDDLDVDVSMDRAVKRARTPSTTASISAVLTPEETTFDVGLPIPLTRDQIVRLRDVLNSQEF